MPDVAADPRSLSLTRLLQRADIAALMSVADYLAAAEAGFRCYANGDADVPLPMQVLGQGGTFHAKGARVALGRDYVAVKVNGNFPGNPERTGLPTIQGVLVLCDASSGRVLAVMDAIEITLRRTAAATALAARFLAREDADSIAICGCGAQGRAQLAALTQVMTPGRVLAWDQDAEAARAFAREMRDALGLDVTALRELHDATSSSDVIVTSTTARTPFLTRELVPAGAFVAAVGADSPTKNELAPELLAVATLVVDSLAQCAVMGDLHHAIAAGCMTTADVHAELGDLVVGRKPGRSDQEEITIFDSTGVAVQDTAAAAWIYQRACTANRGSSIEFGAS